jgi:cobalamin biosynthesis protein CobT
MRRENRIEETFRATIALAEVLNRLGVNFEILGFNCEIHEFKTFHQRMGPEVRDKMATMPNEVEYEARARYNDDGWALTVVSERLNRERNENKFLIVLSDGHPEPSPDHATCEFELSSVINKIRKPGDKILIGLGVGKDTKHVESYYPNSIANISVQELPKKLAEILEQAIRNPEQFFK